MDFKEKNFLKIKACQIRLGAITAIYYAKSGHPGGSLSSADVLTYLYFKTLRINPEDPKNEERDRFVLSKGHAAPALYATLAERGFFDKSRLKTLRQLGSILQGHPNMNLTPGVDMCTGSLGQGASASAGMAAAYKLKNSDYRVYALLGDGELEEGQVYEAAQFASHNKLNNLCWIIDNNNLQIDGRIDDVAGLKNIPQKFEAFGFNTIETTGHDFERFEYAFDNAYNSKDKPSAIIMNTIKGKGVSFMENEAKWHGAAPSDSEYNEAVAQLKNELRTLGVADREI